MIRGEDGTLYENGTFYLSINLPDQYPMLPPVINFVTKIMHPNIGIDGKISIDILRDK